MNYPNGDRYNKLLHIRPTSTFDNFTPQNDAMRDLVTGLQKLSTGIAEVANTGENISLFSAKLIGISGTAGLGKTHLSEAFIMEIKKYLTIERSEEWIRKNILLCRDFGLLSANNLFKDYPIIILDDLFSEYQTLKDVGDYRIRAFGEFIQETYDERKLVLVSSNFSLKDIAEEINKIDTVGRIKSRLAELLAGGTRDFPLSGQDYRTLLAEMYIHNGIDPFEL